MNDAASTLLNRPTGDTGPHSDALAVRDVMSTEPTCVGPDANVLELVRIFHEKQFRHLLVTDSEQTLLGVVSDRDVVRCFGPTDYPDQTLLAGIRTEAVMSPDVITIDADAPLTAAIDMMHDQGVSCLPVLDGRRLVGIVTTSDLMRLLRRILAG
jgi:acetoin utilization protein AcuB